MTVTYEKTYNEASHAQEPAASQSASLSDSLLDNLDIDSVDLDNLENHKDQQLHDKADESEKSEQNCFEALEQKYDLLLAEREKEKKEYLLSKADMENLRKRLQKDQLTQSQYVLESFLKDLLPSLDSLEKALENEGQNHQAILKGVVLVQKQLLGVLEKHGLEKVEASVPSSFDPNVHQAVKQETSAEVSSEQVVGVFQNGYKLHSRLLRPAMVYVKVPLSSSQETQAVSQAVSKEGGSVEVS